MSISQICLLGIMLFDFVLLKDCTAGGDKSSVFVKTSDSIIFNFVEHGFFYHFIEHFVVERIQNETKERICRFDILVDIPGGDLLHEDCSSHSNNRASVALIDADYIMLDVVILKAEKADNGTYMISGRRSGISKCFTVFILGQPSTELEVSTSVIEEGTSGTFKCISTSTTIPGTHNLTIQTSWLVNNTSVESIGRFQIDGNDLIIHYATRMDNNITVSCKTVEERGLTTFANTTLTVRWGPDPVPKLQPPNTFYNLDPGQQLLPINCFSDCNPPCELRWEKIGSQNPLSINGFLSLGKLETISSGEYVCTAKRNQTFKTGRISIIIIINEDTPTAEFSHSPTTVGGITQTFYQNYTPVAVVGGLLGTALLAAFIFIVLLLRRGSCGAVFKSSTASKRESRTAEMELQYITNYEGLSQRNNASPTYDELNLGMAIAGDKCASKTTTSGKEVYENTQITDK